MNLALQVQYDNISGNLGLSLRYRWEYEPGNEIFFGIGQSPGSRPGFPRQDDTNVAARGTHVPLLRAARIQRYPTCPITDNNWIGITSHKPPGSTVGILAGVMTGEWLLLARLCHSRSTS